MGAILATWLVTSTPETAGKKTTHYIDNQAIIKALTTPNSAAGQYLLSSIRQAANRTGSQLTIRWISSHSKVKGNEAVDKLAKDAAAGRSSARARLPHILRSPLPASALAIKQEYISTLKNKWSTLWGASPRKARLAQFGEAFPFSTFLKRLDSLTRKQSSIILQLRCGHLPLNVYLHRINKSESDRCQACYDEEEQVSHPETINHFIFICPAYNEARTELIDRISLNHFHLSNIMKDTNRLKALTTYINRTGRFRD